MFETMPIMTHFRMTNFRKSDERDHKMNGASSGQDSSAHFDSMQPRRRPTRNTKRSALLLSLLVLAAPDTTTAQSEDICSCSPREFVFKLDLSANCPPLPPPFPPNDVFGEGVRDYTCTIGPEPSASGQGDAGPESSAVEDVRRLTMDAPNVDDLIIPTIVDPEPAVIDSIQFFEVDPGFNVINQDPSFVRNVQFVDGDTFNYSSISNLFTTSGKVSNETPGGIIMILRGYNANGERVRNRFTITYTNDCGVPTFNEGDAIGWVVFDSFVPALQETCGSASIVPTPVQSPIPTLERTSIFPTLVNPAESTVAPTPSEPRSIPPTRDRTLFPSVVDPKMTNSPTRDKTLLPSAVDPKTKYPTKRPSFRPPLFSYDYHPIYEHDPRSKCDKTMELPVEYFHLDTEPDRAGKGGKDSKSKASGPNDWKEYSHDHWHHDDMYVEAVEEPEQWHDDTDMYVEAVEEPEHWHHDDMYVEAVEEIRGEPTRGLRVVDLNRDVDHTRGGRRRR